MMVTHPDMAAKVIRECADLGIRNVWLHRSFGQGSVSEEAVAECERHNINCLIGGCPMMYCEPVDFGHRCTREAKTQFGFNYLQFTGLYSKFPELAFNHP
jgi:uncharacterized protein